MAFEITLAGDIVEAVEHRRVFRAEDADDFLFGPDIEFAFLALAVGIHRRIKTAVGGCHFADDPVEGFTDRSQVEFIAGDLPGLGINRHQQAVVVEHLLEMGHEPGAISTVTGKPAPEMIVDPPIGHSPQAAE